MGGEIFTVRQNVVDSAIKLGAAFKMNNLTLLEKDVLEMLLHGDDKFLLNLRRQLEFVVVKNRDFSKAGFFTNFHISNLCKIKDIKSNLTFKIGDIHADIEGLNHGAGFLLYVEDGLIRMLEGYSYDEIWPSTIKEYKLTYIDGERDLEKLRSDWA